MIAHTHIEVSSKLVRLAELGCTPNILSFWDSELFEVLLGHIFLRINSHTCFHVYRLSEASIHLASLHFIVNPNIKIDNFAVLFSKHFFPFFRNVFTRLSFQFYHKI